MLFLPALSQWLIDESQEKLGKTDFSKINFIVFSLISLLFVVLLCCYDNFVIFFMSLHCHIFVVLVYSNLFCHWCTGGYSLYSNAIKKKDLYWHEHFSDFLSNLLEMFMVKLVQKGKSTALTVIAKYKITNRALVGIGC